MSETRSVHFAPIEERRREAALSNGNRHAAVHDPGQKRRASILIDSGKHTLDAVRAAMEDELVIAGKLKGLLSSGNRHGDLQVVRSAALRIAENALLLIESEEHAPEERS